MLLLILKYLLTSHQIKYFYTFKSNFQSHWHYSIILQNWREPIILSPRQSQTDFIKISSFTSFCIQNEKGTKCSKFLLQPNVRETLKSCKILHSNLARYSPNSWNINSGVCLKFGLAIDLILNAFSWFTEGQCEYIFLLNKQFLNDFIKFCFFEE